MKKLELSCGDYEITKTYYRTVGSINQKLVTRRGENIDMSRVFYIAKDNRSRTVFIKKYLDNKDVFKEAVAPEKYRFHNGESYCVGSVKALAVAQECNAIIFPYMANFKKLTKNTFKENMREALRSWVCDNNVDNYDMHLNNILYDGVGILLLCDFEHSPDRHPAQEPLADFIKGI